MNLGRHIKSVVAKHEDDALHEELLTSRDEQIVVVTGAKTDEHQAAKLRLAAKIDATFDVDTPVEIRSLLDR